MGQPPTQQVYGVARQRHVQALVGRLMAESEKLWWPLERLHQLRDERLRDLIRHAQQQSPWHAARLRHIDPDSISGDDLSAIPPMTKADVMAHWDEIVTDRRLTLQLASDHLTQVAAQGPAYLLDEYHVVTTGGSSGLTGVFVWDWDGWLEVGLAAWRPVPWLIRELGLSQSGRTAYVGAAYASHISSAIRATFDISGDSCDAPVTLPLTEIVARLNAFAPDQLVAYPSMLRRLAVEKEAGRLQISPRVMLGGAEPLPPHLRRSIESAFGAPVLDFYATTETWMMGCSYPGRPELHLAEDITVYEPVDQAGAPVKPGDRAAKILVTNVVNQVFPLIRYEIPDEVQLLDTPNPSPWTGRRMAPLEARHEDLFVYPGDIAVHPYVFRTALEDDVRIAQYQVRQTETGADILLELQREVSLPDLSDTLAKALVDAGLPDPTITLTIVDRVERSAQSGKVRYFVALPR